MNMMGLATNFASLPANLAGTNSGWNFLDMLKGAGGWLLGADKSGTPNWMNAAGLAGGLYSGLQQQKAANKALQMQQDAYNFNKMLSQREIDRQNRAEQNLYDGWNASTFAR